MMNNTGKRIDIVAYEAQQRFRESEMKLNNLIQLINTGLDSAIRSGIETNTDKDIMDLLQKYEVDVIKPYAVNPAAYPGLYPTSLVAPLGSLRGPLMSLISALSSLCCGPLVQGYNELGALLETGLDVSRADLKGAAGLSASTIAEKTNSYIGVYKYINVLEREIPMPSAPVYMDRDDRNIYTQDTQQNAEFYNTFTTQPPIPDPSSSRDIQDTIQPEQGPLLNNTLTPEQLELEKRKKKRTKIILVTFTCICLFITIITAVCEFI